MRWLAFALVAALLPGCLFGECDYRKPSVAFHDGGLFAAIPAAAGHGWSVSQAPAQGLLVHNAALEARFGHVALSSVDGPSTGLGTPSGRQFGESFTEDRVELTDGGRVQVVVNDSAPPQAYRAPTLRFLENVTAWDGAQRAAWTDRFLATRVLMGEVFRPDLRGNESRLSWFGHQLELGDAPRLDALVARLVTEPPSGPIVAADGWSVALEVPPRLAERGATRFTVDPWGNHTFEGGWPQKDVGAAVALPDYQAAFASLGLDRAAPEGRYAFSGAIC